MMAIELIRGDERLVCDWNIWRNTTELAKAFGWKRKSINPRRQTLSNLSNWIEGVEVAEEEALSLARSITECLDVLATDRRPARAQMACLLWFAGKGDFDEDAVSFHLVEPARIARFCKIGGFRLSLAS